MAGKLLALVLNDGPDEVVRHGMDCFSHGLVRLVSAQRDPQGGGAASGCGCSARWGFPPRAFGFANDEVGYRVNRRPSVGDFGGRSEIMTLFASLALLKGDHVRLRRRIPGAAPPRCEGT